MNSLILISPSKEEAFTQLFLVKQMNNYSLSQKYEILMGIGHWGLGLRAYLTFFEKGCMNADKFNRFCFISKLEAIICREMALPRLALARPMKDKFDRSSNSFENHYKPIIDWNSKNRQLS